MNTVNITGRLARDPELRKTSDGTSVVQFCVAVPRPGKKDETDWIDCVAWEGRAEFVVKWFRKGSRIEISGTLVTRTYTDREERRRKVTEVRANDIGFADSRPQEQQSSAAQSAPAGWEEFTDDSLIPF